MIIVVVVHHKICYMAVTVAGGGLRLAGGGLRWVAGGGWRWVAGGYLYMVYSPMAMEAQCLILIILKMAAEYLWC